MKKFIKGIALSTSGFLVIMLYIGCTPGKAQTRANDYKGNFGTEEYEAFDTNDNTGNDTIPKYSNNNSSNGNQKTYNSKGYDGNNSQKSYVNNGNERNNSNRNNIKPVKNSYSNDSNQNRGFDVANDNNSGYSNTGYVRNSNTNSQFRNDRFYQKGTASWYGREFHGKVTASGERFDMNSYTAAHKTLPFGTILEVRSLKSGKSVRLKVNDRGPYKGNRIIDLSYGAAKELNIVGMGTTEVGINVIKMGNNSTTYNRNNNSKYVEPVSDRDINRGNNNRNYSSDYQTINLKLQAGAFYSKNNAEKLKSRIEMKTDKPVRIVRDGDFFKVRVEGFRNNSEAERVKDSLSNDRISSFVTE